MRSITKSGEKRKYLWTCLRSEECVPLWWRGSCWRAGSQGCQHQIAGTSTAIINVKTKYLIPVQDFNTYIPSLLHMYYPRTLTVSDRKKLSCLSSKLLSWKLGLLSRILRSKKKQAWWHSPGHCALVHSRTQPWCGCSGYRGYLGRHGDRRGFWSPLKGRSVLDIPRQLGPHLYKRYVDSMSSGLRG